MLGAGSSMLCAIGLSVVALPSFAEGKSPYKGSRIFWDVTTQRTVFKNGGYARMIELRDGRLMAVTERSGIEIAFSSDMGDSWTEPVKIVTNPTALPECVPDLIQLSDGTILVGYNPRPTSPYSPERRFGIHLKRSTDNGVTWSDDIRVRDADYTFDNGCWEPSFLELPSGEVHLYYADEEPYTSNSDQQISLCRSFDGGVTWSDPEKVSYRTGWRDGMPSAVILNDGNIAMAYEDNGCPGFEGSFMPAISVCPLTTNWHDYWTDGASPNRWQARDYSFVSSDIRGGAPYLRVLPWGETVLSHQSTYNNNGRHNMFVYVGDEHAKNFKAACAPFRLNSNEEALWTSLAVVDTGVVVAVAPISGHVEMMKGYPVSMLQAAYATPTVDGTQVDGEGYYKDNASQIILGREKGTRFTGDFAYDTDSLYFTSLVSDADQVAESGSNGDGISLYLDTDYASSLRPEPGMFCFFFRVNGTMEVSYGATDLRSWKRCEAGDTLNVHYAVARHEGYYVVEAAIPWSSMGIEGTPAGRLMRANVMLHNRASSGTTPVYEMLPDASRDASWSWMDLLLRAGGGSVGVECVESAAPKVVVSGRQLSVSQADVERIALYAADGRCLGVHSHCNTVSLPQGSKGLVAALITLKNGDVISRKIIM